MALLLISIWQNTFIRNYRHFFITEIAHWFPLNSHQAFNPVTYFCIWLANLHQKLVIDYKLALAKILKLSITDCLIHSVSYKLMKTVVMKAAYASSILLDISESEIFLECFILKKRTNFFTLFVLSFFLFLFLYSFSYSTLSKKFYFSLRQTILLPHVLLYTKYLFMVPHSNISELIIDNVSHSFKIFCYLW